MEKPGFRVIIIGGSIAGLTLANCLQKARIDFLVLERRATVAPQVGASIGILPNGARILDQLGVYNQIEELIVPLVQTSAWTKGGQLLIRADTGNLLHARFSYPTTFLDRQAVLQILYDGLEDKSKVVVNKKVVAIDDSETVVNVHCDDGSQYTGDVVAGADGVHSVTRKEMWRYATELESILHDKTALFSEYRCMFGISTPVAGFQAGSSYRIFDHDWSTLIIAGKDDRCYWFILEKTKRYAEPEIPRYSQADEEEFFRSYKDWNVGAGVSFQSVWDRRVSWSLVPLEEAQYKHWTFGRIACLGDSIHKMTPNAGQGGNAAIESAAALANCIVKITEATSETIPSRAMVVRQLKSYQASRQNRSNHIAKSANKLTRIEALASWKERLFAYYILPRATDALADRGCDSIVGATKVDYLSLPARSFTGQMQFDPQAGVGHKESKFRRALWALPLLGAAYYCRRHIFAPILSLTRPFIIKSLMSGFTQVSNGTTIGLRSTLYGVTALDQFLRPYMLAFTPSITGIDPAQRLQMIGFMADLIPVQIIMAIEARRRGNLSSLTSFIAPMGVTLLGQLKGIGAIGPLYYFLHYVESAQDNYLAEDNKMVVVGDAKVIIPALTLGYIAPTIAMFLPFFSVATRQWINGAIWQPFPLWVALCQRVFRRFVKDTTPQDRLRAKERTDIRFLRYAYLFGGTVSAAVYLYLYGFASSKYSMREIFFGGALSPLSPVSSLSEGWRRFLQWDQFFGLGSGLLWEMLHFRDLKKTGKMKSGWLKIVGTMAGTTLLFGPGAAMALGWAWREEVMAKRVRYQ